jgi:hypothetical protein
MHRLFKSLIEHIATYAILVFLGVICLAWAVVALVCYPLLPEKPGTAFGRLGIMYGFRLFAWTLAFSGAYRLDLTAIDALRDGPPVVLAPNHPSLIDALLILTCHSNLARIEVGGGLDVEVTGPVCVRQGRRFVPIVGGSVKNEQRAAARLEVHEAVGDVRQGCPYLKRGVHFEWIGPVVFEHGQQ